MKDVFEVAKEATSLIRKNYPISERRLTEIEHKEVMQIVKDTYQKQSLFWRIKHSRREYADMVMLDFKYNFMGGAVVKGGEKITVKVKL